MRKRVYCYGGGILVIILLNVLAWNSSAFCDWYIKWIFPVWVNTYGRITGIFPFSVGEWLIVAGLLLVALFVLSLILRMGIGVMDLVSRVSSIDRREFEKPGRCPGLRKMTEKVLCFFAWAFLIVCLIMTLNCLILYHASTFSEQYFGDDDGDYSTVELILLYNRVAEECNLLSEKMIRDEEGKIPYPGEDGKAYTVSKGLQLEHMADKARECMKQLGEEYPQLDGWYPRPKAMFFSDFMCQQYMQGYYFPFSMEANYNDVMYLLNIPATMCHELAHLRGYIFEDEANLIGYLACVRSEDDFFRYAGNLSVLPYLYNDLYQIWKSDPEEYRKATEEVLPMQVKEQVWQDNVFVTEEEWDRINNKALIDTETVNQAADAFIDTNLKMNGVSDGKISYSRVVRLLLQYNRKKYQSEKNIP